MIKKPIIRTTVAPDALLTLAEAKEHLEIDHSDRDSFITSLVAAASQMIDGYDGMVGKPVAQQTVTITFEDVYAGDIIIPVANAQSLTSITYYDADNVQQSLDLANFRFITGEDETTLEPIAGFVWPAAYERRDAYTITIVAGFATVPDPIKHAARLMVGHWFENREAASDMNIRAIDFAGEALVNRYRIGWVAA